MSTAFIIGNGESRTIFPIEKLKDHGTIYGCNAIYRDHPNLCDNIVSVNPEMSEELLDAQKNNKIPADTSIYTAQNLPKFDYVLANDNIDFGMATIQKKEQQKNMTLQRTEGRVVLLYKWLVITDTKIFL